MGQFSYIVMCIVAPFHKALMAFEEIGTELGTGKGHFQESFLNIAVIQRLHKYNPKSYSHRQTGTNLALILHKTGVKILANKLYTNMGDLTIVSEMELELL